jgi:hypothetical protein
MLDEGRPFDYKLNEEHIKDVSCNFFTFEKKKIKKMGGLCYGLMMTNSYVIAEVIGHQLVTMVAWVQSQVRSCGICGEQSGIGMGFLQVCLFRC